MTLPPAPEQTSTLVEAWRHYDPQARDLEGMGLGTLRLSRDAEVDARELYASGARHVRFVEPIRLGDGEPRSLLALLLLREFTSHGFSVEWEIRCEDVAEIGPRLGHLHPPLWSDKSTPALQRALRAWHADYFPGRCVFRRGPGFVEVRDRRFGTLQVLTLDTPEHIAAVGQLAAGVPAGELVPAVRDDLIGARLVAAHDDLLWWLPTRLYRWPLPTWAL
jgi:hypothetical protein